MRCGCCYSPMHKSNYGGYIQTDEDLKVYGDVLFGSPYDVYQCHNDKCRAPAEGKLLMGHTYPLKKVQECVHHGCPKGDKIAKSCIDPDCKHEVWE